MFPVDPYLDAAARKRLEASWGASFAEHVLPSLLGAEEKLASLYDSGTGRPNWSVARMLAILILAAMFDLPDGEALECLQFDARWHRALGLDRNDAYLSRRSLVDFRARLAQPNTNMERGVFDRVTADAIAKLGASTRQVRLDSTHILSDIRQRSRVALFVDVLDRFLRELSRAEASQFAALPKAMREWYTKEGWSDDARGRGRLEELASWMLLLRDRFAADPAISTYESYALLVRLLGEHCRIGDIDPTVPLADAAAEGAASPSGAAPVGPPPPAPTEGSPTDGSPSPASEASPAPAQPTPPSLELPHVEILPTGAAGGRGLTSAADPDVQFGHKGGGYEVQVAETCGEGPARFIVDYDVTAPPDSDTGQAAATVARLVARGLGPETLFVDAGYTAASSFADVAALGTTLEGPVRMERLRRDQVGRDAFAYDPTTGRIVACPAGHPVIGHGQYQQNSGSPIVPTAQFDRRLCEACPLRERCVVLVPKRGGRANVRDTLKLRLRDEALARQRDATWRRRQRVRTGCEATNSELKRAHGMRRLRVRRRRRVEIAVAFAVTACNVKRWIRAMRATPPPTPRPRRYQPRKATV